MQSYSPSEIIVIDLNENRLDAARHFGATMNAMATIVVIDSEDTVRAVITKILERGGHSVRACEALGEAIDGVAATRPDLVLTNVYLRDSTGHDAIEILKKILPDVPVLMVSGLPDEEVIEHWRETRGFDTFPKPFTASSLLSKVSEMLAGTPPTQF